MTRRKIPDDREPADRVDYAQRKRNLEWRRRWFEISRDREGQALVRQWQEGFRRKWRMIEEQRAADDPMAAYAPAGTGTPWVTIGPRNINGRVKALAVHPTDPNTVYAGAASGGVWKSIDAGQSWRPLWDMQDTMSIAAIAIAPGAPATIYVGTGEWTPGWGPTFGGTGVFVSTDAGVTWTQRTSVTARRIAQILVSPTNANTVYVAGINGFERSADGGVNWTTLHGGEISDALIDPTNGNVMYIAVRSDGLYKSTDGGTSWAKLGGGAPAVLGNPSPPNAADWIRLAMGRNGAAGTNLLLAKRAGTIYRSTDGGTSWTTLAGLHGDSGYDEWCNLLAVALDDDNVILAGGVGLERTANGGGSWTWPGGPLHSDHHRAVFAPSSPTVVYSCNDGGVFRSTDKGANWLKTSDGLIITQFYDVGSWTAIGTVVGGGTQDNGTLVTHGGLTWKHILGGDGGYLVFHPGNPRIIYAEHQNTAIRKTVNGGASWVAVTAGLMGTSQWVGILTMDPNAHDTLFAGTQQVFRTTDGCATAWVASSQPLAANVSGIAVAESDTNRVYASTGTGKVFRSDNNGASGNWADMSTGLPAAPATDVVVSPTDKDRVAVTFGGAGIGHVFLSANGGTSWTNVNGNLPDVTTSAFAFDPLASATFYVGTDVGVFRTTDGGATWQAFDNGIPNVPITDLHVDRIGSLLIAATMGRGMYKVSINGVAEPAVDLYLRDSLLDTGERFPSPSSVGIPDPFDATEWVFNWESPDIKVDSLPYSVPDALFDGVEFDEMTHEDPQRTEVNRIYLQLHNRGWQNATNVSVRAFIAAASAGLPPLPAPLVPPNFNLPVNPNWTPVGAAQTVALLEPNRPVIVSWDYTIPATADTHSCVLAVISSAQDPMTNNEVSIGPLLVNEKRVCLKNLHVINSQGPQQTLARIRFHNAFDRDDLIDIEIDPLDFSDGTIGLLLPPVTFADADRALEGVEIYPLGEGEDIGRFQVGGGQRDFDGQALLARVDRSQLYEFSARGRSALRGIGLRRGEALQGILTFKGSKHVPHGQTQRFAVVQRQSGEIVGGSTYELRLTRARALLPVSRIRIILEKVQILDDHEPWFKGRGDFQFTTMATFNGEPSRRHMQRIPETGVLKISAAPGRNERVLNACLFDGLVAEADRLELAILPLEKDTLDPDDPLVRFRRSFDGPPESWVGRYVPDDEPDDPERRKDWLLWYRIESLPL